MVKKWHQKRGVLIMGYEAYERLTRSTDECNKQIIEALVEPGRSLFNLWSCSFIYFFQGQI